MQELFKLATKSDENLLIEMMQEFYKIENLTFNEQTTRIALEQILNDSRIGLIYLIQYLGEIAGYFVLTFCFSLEYHGRLILLDELYLREAYQGKGIGKKTINFIDEIGRQEAVKVVILEVSPINTKALNIYLKAGYENNGRYPFVKWLDKQS